MIKMKLRNIEIRKCQTKKKKQKKSTYSLHNGGHLCNVVVVVVAGGGGGGPKMWDRHAERTSIQHFNWQTTINV